MTARPRAPFPCLSPSASISSTALWIVPGSWWVRGRQLWDGQERKEDGERRRGRNEKMGAALTLGWGSVLRDGRREDGKSVSCRSGHQQRRAAVHEDPALPLPQQYRVQNDPNGVHPHPRRSMDPRAFTNSRLGGDGNISTAPGERLSDLETDTATCAGSVQGSANPQEKRVVQRQGEEDGQPTLALYHQPDGEQRSCW